jgi:IclR family transcriptional regulator, KDG regulon repressor
MSTQANNDGTVGKALSVLDLVADFGRPVRFSEILENSNQPKATLYRFLQTLTNQRLLSYEAERQTYSLGMRLVGLAHLAWKQSSLAPIARPFLDKLSAATGETIHLAQLDNGQVLYVDKCNAKNPVDMYSQAGKVGPGYCTGVGKAIMAFLPKEKQERALRQQAYFQFTEKTHLNAATLRDELDVIAETGFSYDREEHEAGIICIAVPILTENKRVLGGISITSTTTQTSLEGMDVYKSILSETAQQIGTTAANWQFPT